MSDSLLLPAQADGALDSRQKPALRPASTDRRFARLFNLESAQVQATTTLKRAQLTLARLTSNRGSEGMTSPFPVEKAYIVALQLSDAGRATLWKGGRHQPTPPLAEGAITITHLEDQPAFNFPDPFDCLVIHMPQITFDELADSYHAPRISELVSDAVVSDPVVTYLGHALLPIMAAPRPIDGLFFDHVAFAIQSRLASLYGRLTESPDDRSLHLSSWQERTALELLTSDLADKPTIEDVAGACGLSVGRFIRAFRGTTGLPPHRWLRGVRVERAKELLVHSSLSLAQIAYDCGFADQSHFSRVFMNLIGMAPGAWRRARRS